MELGGIREGVGQEEGSRVIREVVDEGIFPEGRCWQPFRVTCHTANPFWGVQR